MKQALKASMSTLRALRVKRIAVAQVFAATAMAVFASFAFAQGTKADTSPAPDSGGVVGRYPAGSIKSSKMAEAALADVSKEHSAIETRFVAEDQACHPQFFATLCMEQAKERRRLASRQLHQIENEAHAFQRQERVAERDQALASKRVQEQADGQERVRRQQAYESMAARKAADGASDGKASETMRKVHTSIFSDRDARHEAKLKRLRAQETAEAKKRAENVAAHEKKVQEAQARQKEVAAKKAEKEQKRRLRQASAPNSK